jgi:hypothetical protein
VQAAEIHLRRHLGVTRIGPLPLVQHVRQGTLSTAVFDVDGCTWEVRVRTEFGERRQLTCRAAATSVGPMHRLESLSRVPAPSA